MLSWVMELPFQGATWHTLFYFQKYLPIEELFHVCQDAIDLEKMYNMVSKFSNGMGVSRV